MGDPNQSLMSYQDPGYPTPLLPQRQAVIPAYADDNAPPMSIGASMIPPPIPPELVTSREPAQIVGRSTRKSPVAVRVDETTPLTAETDAYASNADAIRSKNMSDAAASERSQHERDLERAYLLKGSTRAVTVGPTAAQLALAESNKKYADMEDEKVRQFALQKQIEASGYEAKAAAEAKMKAEMFEREQQRVHAINKEVDQRFAAVDAMQVDPDKFWTSREAGAKARAIDAVAAWRIGNDMQAMWMHNPSGASQSNAVFDMYKQAIDQNVALQLKNRDFASNQLKERISILGSREAAEKSLELDGYKAMQAKFDAMAAEAKTPQAAADIIGASQKALATRTGLEAEIRQLTSAHVSKQVNEDFIRANLDLFKKHPDLFAAIDPKMAKEQRTVDKDTGELVKTGAEVRKLGADAQKSQSEASGAKSGAADISKEYVKANLPQMEGNARAIDAMLAKGDDAPGTSWAARKLEPRVMMGEEARTNQQAIQQGKNLLVLLRSGKAVSEHEEKRLVAELDGAGTYAELARTLREIRGLYTNTKDTIDAGNPAGAETLARNRAAAGNPVLR